MIAGEDLAARVDEQLRAGRLGVLTETKSTPAALQERWHVPTHAEPTSAGDVDLPDWMCRTAPSMPLEPLAPIVADEPENAPVPMHIVARGGRIHEITVAPTSAGWCVEGAIDALEATTSNAAALVWAISEGIEVAEVRVLNAGEGR